MLNRWPQLVRCTPLTVAYATSDSGCTGCPSSAVPGVDYLPTSGTLLFDVGETNKSFTIPILDNGRVSFGGLRRRDIRVLCSAIADVRDQVDRSA